MYLLRIANKIEPQRRVLGGCRTFIQIWRLFSCQVKSYSLLLYLQIDYVQRTLCPMTRYVALHHKWQARILSLQPRPAHSHKEMIQKWVLRIAFRPLQSPLSLRVFWPSPELVSFLKSNVPSPFRCEHSHCRDTPFEAGPFVSFFAVLVIAQLVGRCSSPFKFLEKTRFRGCMSRETSGKIPFLSWTPPGFKPETSMTTLMSTRQLGYGWVLRRPRTPYSLNRFSSLQHVCV